MEPLAPVTAITIFLPILPFIGVSYKTKLYANCFPPHIDHLAAGDPLRILVFTKFGKNPLPSPLSEPFIIQNCNFRVQLTA